MSHAPTPVLPLSAALVAFVNTGITFALAFGAELTNGQQAAISSLTNSVVLLVIAASHFYRAQRAESERWSHLNGNE